MSHYKADFYIDIFTFPAHIKKWRDYRKYIKTNQAPITNFEILMTNEITKKNILHLSLIFFDE